MAVLEPQASRAAAGGSIADRPVRLGSSCRQDRISGTMSASVKIT
jgi:hypothetical protein